MRKLLTKTLLGLALLLNLQFALCEEPQRIVDQTSTLSAEQLKLAETEIAQILRTTGVDLGVLVVNGHSSATIRDFSYVQLALRGVREDGLPRAVLVVDLKPEESHLALSAEAEPYLSPGAADWISEHELRSLIHRESLGVDLLNALKIVRELFDQSRRGSPLAAPLPRSSLGGFILQALLIAVFMGFFVGEIFRGIFGTIIASVLVLMLTYLFGQFIEPASFAACTAIAAGTFTFSDLLMSCLSPLPFSCRSSRSGSDRTQVNEAGPL